MFIKEKAKDAISLYVCRHKNTHDLFVIHKKDISVENIKNDRKLYCAYNEKEFIDLCENFGFSVPDADIKQRFEQNDAFCVIADSKSWGCWGWVAVKQRNYYVLEIDSYSQMPENTCVLYHFFANPKRRRQGFYYDILRLVPKKFDKDFSFIYAYGYNEASTGAIRKAGYRFAGTMTHKTFCGFSEMIKNYSEYSN